MIATLISTFVCTGVMNFQVSSHNVVRPSDHKDRILIDRA